jgi:2-amino-4-hydroxy-6-hydroxymethyldihydropteridine diphosphokinase
MIAAIGLGSNIEPRLRYLTRALIQLDRLPGCRLLGVSRIWGSRGWGREDLADFFNAVAILQSEQQPEALLSLLRRIEDGLGRQRTEHWGPRTLDLDLLACDDLQIQSVNLQLPHPWIAHRPFVYRPLSELVAHHPAWAELYANPPAAAREQERDSVATDLGIPIWGHPILPPWRSASLVTVAEEETLAVMQEMAGALVPGDLVFLEGEMGAGKSVAARGIARGIGITGPIQSPTYTLCRQYSQGATKLEHWDLYRLSSADDLESAGYFALDSNAMRVVEWANMFPTEAGSPTVRIRLEVIDSQSRRLTFDRPGDRLPAPVAAVVKARGGEGS